MAISMNVKPTIVRGIGGIPIGWRGKKNSSKSPHPKQTKKNTGGGMRMAAESSRSFSITFNIRDPLYIGWKQKLLFQWPIFHTSWEAWWNRKKSQRQGARSCRSWGCSATQHMSFLRRHHPASLHSWDSSTSKFQLAGATETLVSLKIVQLFSRHHRKLVRE